MRAVLIGGNGFLGGHLTDHLMAGGWGVVSYDVAPERYREPLEDVDYVTASLGDTGMLRDTLPGADVVFHLVSTTIPQSSNDAPQFDIRSNLIDTVNLLEQCARAGVGRVVFISSGGTVYGIPQRLPVDEDHPTDPICSYGIVKLAIEKYLHLYHQLHGLRYTVLRPANPIGARQNPLGRQGVTSVFLGRIATGEPIRIWGDGEVVRDFFDVDDLAEACVAAATSEHGEGVYNIGSGVGTSLNELLREIEQVVDQPVHVERLPARDFDVPAIRLDITRAGRELGWLPTGELSGAIAKAWDWVRRLAWVPGPHSQPAAHESP